MIDWTKPLCTKHETPLIGRAMDDCRTGIKRVAISSVSLPTWGPTIHRFDSKGRARQGAGPSDFDLVNYDENDGAIRITPDGQKIVCSTAKAA